MSGLKWLDRLISAYFWLLWVLGLWGRDMWLFTSASFFLLYRKLDDR